MEWKYVKPLSSVDCINEFESLVNYSFPTEFKNCVLHNNGGRPNKRVFDTDVQRERSLKTFLSFNKEDRETIWKILEWNKTQLLDNYIAFAIDNFGNLICFDKSKQRIVFYNLESDRVEQIANNFSEFMRGLYE